MVEARACKRQILSSRSHQLGDAGNPLVFFFSEAQRSRRDILLEMFGRGCPWDGQHLGRSSQEPRQRYLGRTRTVRLRDSVQHFPGNLACSQWEPGDKGNSIMLTITHYVVPFAVGKAIAILHRDD